MEKHPVVYAEPEYIGYEIQEQKREQGYATKERQQRTVYIEIADNRIQQFTQSKKHWNYFQCFYGQFIQSLIYRVFRRVHNEHHLP